MVDAEATLNFTWSPNQNYKTDPNTLPYLKEFGKNVTVGNGLITLPNDNPRAPEFVTYQYPKDPSKPQMGEKSEISVDLLIPKTSEIGGVGISSQDAISQDDLVNSINPATYLGVPASFEVYLENDDYREAVLNEMSIIFGEDAINGRVNFVNTPKNSDNNQFELIYIYENKNVDEIE